MLEELKQHLSQNFDFLHGKKLLLACSGGLDSVVLCELMKEAGYEIGIAHCNFQLRGKESNEDSEFVANLSEKLGVPVYIENFDTKNFAKEQQVSIQMAARDLRYRWFEEIRVDFKYDYIVTAHHADDDLETFLINLSRGSGIRGLTGIPEVNGIIVRPLLRFAKSELLNYAKNNSLFWREDSSNASDDYLRNEIRNQVIPKYQKATKNLLQGFSSTTRNLNMSAHLLEDYMVLVRALVMTEEGEDIHLNIQKLKDLPNTDALLFELLRSFGFTSWSDVSNLLDAQSGKMILSATHQLLKDRETMILTKLEPKEVDTDLLINTLPFMLEEPLRVRFSEVTSAESNGNLTVYVDFDTLEFPLKLRKWREGDFFYPYGMKGKKKVSKFFKDEKLSLVAKERTWLLTSGNKIVWILGMRLDDRFRINPDTSRIVQLKYDQ